MVFKLKWTLEEMKKFCIDNNINYKILEQKICYREKSKQRTLKILVQCDNNHEPYWVDWADIKRGARCKECLYKKLNKQNWLENKQGVIDFFKSNGLEICDIQEFKNCDTKIKCINKDGYIIHTCLSNLKKQSQKGKECNIFHHNKYALENIKLYCKKERPDYEILSEKYMGMNAIHLFRYNGIGLKDGIDRNFYSKFKIFYHDNAKHPYLNKSELELIFESVLIEKGINYKYGYTDHNCRNPKTNHILIFDFAIFDSNNKLIMIVELDGIFHFEQCKRWDNTGDKFKDYLYRDQIKNEYAKDNNIKILRIPYWEKNNIKEIIAKEIK